MLSLIPLLVACTGSEPSAPPPSRVQSVAAAPKAAGPAEAPDAWCDQHNGAAEAKTFSWPALDGDVSPPSPGASWTWVNIWATWCKPCIAEMPRLMEWEPKLQTEIGPGAIRFLSFDASAKALSDFHAQRPEMPTGVRLKDESLMDEWVAGLGLEPSAAALPIHLFLDEQQRVRCLYMGGVEESAYETVVGVLGSI